MHFVNVHLSFYSLASHLNFVVNFIAHGVSYSRIFSCLGRNVQFCSERYGRKVGDIMNANVSLSFIDLDSSSRINPEMHDKSQISL